MSRILNLERDLPVTAEDTSYLAAIRYRQERSFTDYLALLTDLTETLFPSPPPTGGPESFEHPFELPGRDCGPRS